MSRSSTPRNPEEMLDHLAKYVPFLKSFTVHDPGVERFDKEQLEAMAHLRGLISAYFRVEFQGLEHLPKSGRALMVGNHGRTGIDAFIFAAVAAEHLGRPVRPLTDKLFFRIPKLRDYIAALGGVPGTRENATRLLSEDELVVVYPGGNDEVMKPSYEVYQLSWGDRLGFVKVAQTTGAPIIPVAGIGVEEIYVNMPGWDSFEMSPLARWFEDVVGRRYRTMPPLTGILGPVPAPVKLTFKLGPPLPVHDLPHDNEHELLHFQRKVQNTLKKMIREGLQEREHAAAKHDAGKHDAGKTASAHADAHATDPGHPDASKADSHQ